MTDTVTVNETDFSHQLMSDLPEVARDYASYLSVDASKERQAFYNSIEEMLTKLDEFGGSVDITRKDTSECVETIVQNIQKKCEEMRHIFARVDQLEAFVKIVRENVRCMEECVNKAENDMGSFSLKKMFSSLVGPKKTPQSKQNKPVFEPPDIFVTEEYVKPVQSTSQAEKVDTKSTEINNSPITDSNIDQNAEKGQT